MRTPLDGERIKRMAERAATVHRLTTETQGKCSRCPALVGRRYVCSVGKKGAATVEFLCPSCNGKRAAEMKKAKKEAGKLQEDLFK